MGKHAKTQLSSIFSCCVLLTVLLYLAPTLSACPKVHRSTGTLSCIHSSDLCLRLSVADINFAPLPLQCVVAVIIIVAQESLILQVRDCKRFWKISHYEGVSGMSAASTAASLFAVAGW